LSWWQKLLKAIGLYKEPVRPPRPERKASPEAPAAEARPPKSNTRNARSDESGAGEKPGPSSKRSGRGSGERPRGGDGSTVESLRVYVGNLSYDVTEQDLQELFKGIGPVRSVEIVYNRSTHRSKGYGFVEMLRKDEAVRAVEVLHDQHFMGRKLTVSGAKSKGMDDRDEVEDRPTSESRTVTLAPLPPREPEAAVASGPATQATAEAGPLAEESPEPVIQTIVETVRESAVAEEPQAGVAAEATEDDRPASV
jgi:RNA recognition motif-containing protein